MNGTLVFPRWESVVLFVDELLSREGISVSTLTIKRKPQGAYSVTYVIDVSDGTSLLAGCEKQPTISTTRLLELDNYDGA